MPPPPSSLGAAPEPGDPLVGQDKRCRHNLTITIQRSGDHDADVERLRLIHDLLTDFPGEDLFKFHLVGEGNGNLELAFPNDRTCYCPELAQELVSILGPDCYSVDCV